MATDNGHRGIGGLGADGASKEAGGTDNVKGGDTEETSGIEDASFLKSSSNDGNSGVNGVSDNEDMCSGSNAGDG